MSGKHYVYDDNRSKQEAYSKDEIYNKNEVDIFQNYNYEKTIIGRWVDGSPIYRQVFILDNNKLTYDSNSKQYVYDNSDNAINLNSLTYLLSVKLINWDSSSIKPPVSGTRLKFTVSGIWILQPRDQYNPQGANKFYFPIPQYAVTINKPVLIVEWGCSVAS